MKIIFALLLLLLPLLLFAQYNSELILAWDAACTDTQGAINATDSLVSCPFHVNPDMSLVVYVQAGDTSNATTLDSTKVRFYTQFSLDASNWKYSWCETDSIGLDSTTWSRRMAGVDGQLSTSMQPPIDISTTCPVSVDGQFGWGRMVAKGLSTNCKTSTDSTKFSAHIARYFTN